MNNHYFESGNIRFDLAKDFKDGIQGQAIDGSIAKGIVAAIQKAEEDYQNSLEPVYQNITENHMKKLRRILPVTGTNFDWNGRAN